jgi:hypothetical protein
MKKSRRLVLCVLSLILLPFGLSDSPAPVYPAITSPYAPTASYRLVDDSAPDLAVVEISLSNPTKNLIALARVFFGPQSDVQSNSSASYGMGSAYLDYWTSQSYPEYMSKILLAPESNYLARRTSIHKSAGLDYAKEALTYQALKNGSPLVSAFDGEVYAATTYEAGVDFFSSAPSLAVSYDADDDKTLLYFQAGDSFSAPKIKYDERFYSFSYAAADYEAAYGNSEDAATTPWVKGNHAKEEFSNLGISLYKKGETLFATDNYTNNFSLSLGLSDIIRIVMIGVLSFVGLSLLAGLIVLLVWLGRKKKQNRTPTP